LSHDVSDDNISKNIRCKDFLSYFSTIEMFYSSSTNENINNDSWIVDLTLTKTCYEFLFLCIFLEMKGKSQTHHTPPS
jgi:hypothetical protein